ncbi:MAG: hypothetical protein ACTSSH_04760 [Candidatus Heimdallarchaeota archaeon]
MLDEILIIQESLPIFYYNRDPDMAYDEDRYILQSGFFVALSAFANEMSDEKLKYIVLENRLYALDEVSNILLIFGDKEKMSESVIQKLQTDLAKAANYLNTLLGGQAQQNLMSTQGNLNEIATQFGDYLIKENLIEDDATFEPYKSRSMMQKFIFKTIGYQPGQCNIGPAERLKRLMMAIPFLFLAIVGALLIFFLDANPYYAFILAVPLLMFFFGMFQYFFKFCAINGLTKKYDMR